MPLPTSSWQEATVTSSSATPAPTETDEATPLSSTAAHQGDQKEDPPVTRQQQLSKDLQKEPPQPAPSSLRAPVSTHPLDPLHHPENAIPEPELNKDHRQEEEEEEEDEDISALIYDDILHPGPSCHSLPPSPSISRRATAVSRPSPSSRRTSYAASVRIAAAASGSSADRRGSGAGGGSVITTGQDEEAADDAERQGGQVEEVDQTLLARTPLAILTKSMRVVVRPEPRRLLRMAAAKGIPDPLAEQQEQTEEEDEKEQEEARQFAALAQLPEEWFVLHHANTSRATATTVAAAGGHSGAVVHSPSRAPSFVATSPTNVTATGTGMTPSVSQQSHHAPPVSSHPTLPTASRRASILTTHSASPSHSRSAGISPSASYIHNGGASNDAVGAGKYEQARKTGIFPLYTLPEVEATIHSFEVHLKRLGVDPAVVPVVAVGQRGEGGAKDRKKEKQKEKEATPSQKRSKRERDAHVVETLQEGLVKLRSVKAREEERLAELRRQGGQGAAVGGVGAIAPAEADAAADAAGVNAALAVRRNLLYSIWTGYVRLTKGRRLLFLVRLLSALAQVIATIVILSLPASLGDSPAAPGTGDSTSCDPEPMFVWLVLHALRVALAAPLDLYLGLSPHRTSRARRPAAQGLAEREQARALGSLTLDRKMGRISDLIGLAQVALFIAGNYIVFSNTECSRPPADSIALFWTSFSMLAISYIIILEVVLLIVAIVFFLPMVVFVMRALGLGDRLPRAGIRPETSKVEQSVVEKRSRLVYYTPEVDEDEQEQTGDPTDAAKEDRPQRRMERAALALAAASSGEAAPPQMTPSDIDEEEEPRAPSIRSLGSARRGGWIRLFKLRDRRGDEENTGGEDRRAVEDGDEADRWIGRRRRKRQAQDGQPGVAEQRRMTFGFGMWQKKQRGADGDAEATHASAGGQGTLRHPFHKLPAHRATCPICLCDFERAEQLVSAGEEQPEPLRLLDCSHVFHMSCVDEWLTTVSGRCPVCQKPIVEDPVPANQAADAAVA